MKHLEVIRKWCKKIEIEIFDKWLISLDHVTNIMFYNLDWGDSSNSCSNYSLNTPADITILELRFKFYKCTFRWQLSLCEPISWVYLKNWFLTITWITSWDMKTNSIIYAIWLCEMMDVDHKINSFIIQRLSITLDWCHIRNHTLNIKWHFCWSKRPFDIWSLFCQHSSASLRLKCHWLTQTKTHLMFVFPPCINSEYHISIKQLQSLLNFLSWYFKLFY